MAYPTAISCGCLLGAGGVSHLHAAEWSVQPIFTVATDYDSDRNLEPDIKGSEEAVLYGDLKLQRALENTQIVLEPKFDLRRYSDSVWGPGNDRSLNAALVWVEERLKMTLTGFIANQTTLSTEVFESGVINGDTRRRTGQANGEWDWSENERRQTFLQLGYLSSKYSGSPLVEFELPGYRYPSASLGERFFLSERLTLSVSAFGEFIDQFTEATSFDISVGQSRRSLSGQSGSGTNGSVTLSHALERGSASLSYVRSLVPYGTGNLVERQQLAAALTRPITPELDVNFSLLRVKNNASTVLLGLDRPYYNNALVGLSWKLGESWMLQPQVSAALTKPIRPVGDTAPIYDRTLLEWRAQLSLVWQPLPAKKSR
jgi:hypothetical protein